jgi:hypothetical protein
MNENQFDALEQALSNLAAGQDPTKLITVNPDLAAELEAAQWAGTLTESQIPAGAAHRSRTRVLARAMQLRPAMQPRGWRFQRIPRLAFALVLALIFLLSWNSLIFASAQALPGDQLYPAKLTLEKLRLGLARNPQTHQKIEAEYQVRRIEEIERLLALGRIEFAQFSGVLEEQENDFWIIQGIEVRLFPETIILGNLLPGMTIEVEGVTQPGGWVQAAEISLRRFSFHGPAEMISNTTWMIAGRDVLIDSSSILDPDIKVGDFVSVEVTSDDFGTLTARSITLLAPGDQAPIATETPTRLENPISTIPAPNETEETEEPDETDEPEEIKEPDETDEHDESEEPEEDETDESDDNETDKSDERDNSDDENKTDER